MNKSLIQTILILVAILAIVVIYLEISSTKPGNKDENIFELNTDEYRNVDEDLINYTEVKQIKTGDKDIRDIAFFEGQLYLLCFNSIELINSNNQIIKTIPIDEDPNALYLNSNFILCCYNEYFNLINYEGDLILRSDSFNERSVFTSASANDSLIFIADAGNRKVIVYDNKGKVVSSFNGSSKDGEYEFVVPSPYFDLAINEYDELWVANPGRHSFQQYDTQGKLKAYIEKSANTLEGFTGCCNPAHFTFTPDGKFITSEKKIVRIKIYSASGELESVVAEPKKFTLEGKAPQITMNELGQIIALDFDKKMIRFFSKK